MRTLTTALLSLLSLPAHALHTSKDTRSSITVVSIKSEHPHHAPAKVAPEMPPVELVGLNTHETFTLRPSANGSFGKTTMKSLSRFLRCHHTQRMHPMSERLARLLYQTSSHFGYATLDIVAGYRAPKIARAKGNPKSPHKRGVACDFRVEGIANEVVRDYVRTIPRTGVGYYPNSGFVHLDVRDKLSAFWVDYSGPGERARYSRTPDEDVRKLAEGWDPDAQDDPEDAPDDVRPETEGPAPQRGVGSGERAPRLPALEAATPREDE